MFYLTRIEKTILEAIREEGGEIKSLWSLANELEISYSHAHQRVCVLELLGIIEIERRRGRPLLLRLTIDGEDSDTAEAVSPSSGRTDEGSEAAGVGLAFGPAVPGCAR